MSLYSSRFCLAVLLNPAGATALFTVPAGRRYLVKQVEITNSSAGAVLADFGVIVSGTASLVQRNISTPANGTSSREVWHVYNAGDIAYAVPGSANVLRVTMFGYDLDAT